MTRVCRESLDAAGVSVEDLDAFNEFESPQSRGSGTTLDQDMEQKTRAFAFFGSSPSLYAPTSLSLTSAQVCLPE